MLENEISEFKTMLKQSYQEKLEEINKFYNIEKYNNLDKVYKKELGEINSRYNENDSIISSEELSAMKTAKKMKIAELDEVYNILKEESSAKTTAKKMHISQLDEKYNLYNEVLDVFKIVIEHSSSYIAPEKLDEWNLEAKTMLLNCKEFGIDKEIFSNMIGMIDAAKVLHEIDKSGIEKASLLLKGVVDYNIHDNFKDIQLITKYGGEKGKQCVQQSRRYEQIVNNQMRYGSYNNKSILDKNLGIKDEREI